MENQFFLNFLTTLGVPLSPEDDSAIIQNDYGEFSINLMTGSVQFKPIKCLSCKKPCGFTKPLCLIQRGAGWSNTDLSSEQLYIIAKIFMIRNGQFTSTIAIQLSFICKNLVPLPPRPIWLFPTLVTLRRLAQISRLAQWSNSLSNPSLAADWQYAVRKIDRLGVKFHIPISIIDRAVQVYCYAITLGLIREQSLEAMIAAILYLACRRMQFPLTLDRLSADTKVAPKTIGRYYRFLERELF